VLSWCWLPNAIASNAADDYYSGRRLFSTLQDQENVAVSEANGSQASHEVSALAEEDGQKQTAGKSQDRVAARPQERQPVTD
jgi:hypothetical protein